MTYEHNHKNDQKPITMPKNDLTIEKKKESAIRFYTRLYLMKMALFLNKLSLKLRPE